MSEAGKPITIKIGQVHLSSLGVSHDLKCGVNQLDPLLMNFANRLLADLILSKNSGVLEGPCRPHLISLGAPYDDDVSQSSPQ